MLPLNKLTVSPGEVMGNKRDILLGYYNETRQSLEELRRLVARNVVSTDQGYDYAKPLLNKLKEYREWLDNQTHNLLTTEQELKDECELNALEATLGSAE